MSAPPLPTSAPAPRIATEAASPSTPGNDTVDPLERRSSLLRDLRTSTRGLTDREAARRLETYGANELAVRARTPWWRELVVQLVHPLALLLWVASALALVTGTPKVAFAIVAVILLNAAFAYVQERHAEHAIEALAACLPQQAHVLRDGSATVVPARELVPGDVLLIDEGDRISADSRLLSGTVEVDMSTLTGESTPVVRSAAAHGRNHGASHLEAHDLLFSGTTCTGGSARAVVHATGSRSELGRIATLSHRVTTEPSPLEQQVRRSAWLIAAVAVGVGIAFLPIGLLAGLSLQAAVLFSIGLLVANVPEGLLPTITLALAAGVRELAHGGAVVKRLSAVETLGSTTVICTDKTGTLTENRMEPIAVWVPDRVVLLDGSTPTTADAQLRELATAMGTCTTARPAHGDRDAAGDPTELAVLIAAGRLGVPVDVERRDADLLRLHAFDAVTARMSVVVADGARTRVYAKGSPEAILAICGAAHPAGRRRLRVDGDEVQAALRSFADQGLRVLAVATRRSPGRIAPAREQAETGLVLLGLIAMHDPLRAAVPAAVTSCHEAGIRIHVITGDHPLTARHIARDAGIGADGMRVVTGAELREMSEPELDAMLTGGDEIVFARSSPEDKLRIADAVKANGDVIAMTGDGVNDAPALRRADLGIAMGASGTDVAREAATMVLTDDDFATIVAAVEVGRRVYDNVRKFVLYIFAHAVPELIPFLAFALSGGLVPLPLTVLQILAIDLGTETLPALALGREPAEPGLMQRPPRARRSSVIDRPLLVRAWGVLGLTSAVLVLGTFFFTLLHGGWSPGDDVTSGSPLHHVYRQATTSTFAAIVACQIGTGFAARTQKASLRSVGWRTNPLLLWGMLFELVFAAAVIYAPAFQGAFGTEALPVATLVLLVPFPLVVWGVDEAYRGLLRRRDEGPRSQSLGHHAPADGPAGGTKVETTTEGGTDDRGTEPRAAGDAPGRAERRARGSAPRAAAHRSRAG